MKNITGNIETGVVGLGLMGSSITVSLLLAGHPVIAVSPLAEELDDAEKRIQKHLMHCEKAGLLIRPINSYLANLTVTTAYHMLNNCKLVLECVIEVIEIKEKVYHYIEAEVKPDTIIASNTSAMPISELQKLLHCQERFLGVHWAEPSYLTRFMEITCGDSTLTKHAQWVYDLAHYWGKEPTLLKRDLRGFVTNRLMYAVYRESFNLLQKGDATLEDMDKAFRYDAGSWMTLTGIFRRMDLIGLKDYSEIFKNIFPQLCNDDKVPDLMQHMIDIKAKGTQNSTGFYSYPADEAYKWEEAFAAFNEQIYKLAALYAENSQPVNSRTNEFKKTS